MVQNTPQRPTGGTHDQAGFEGALRAHNFVPVGRVIESNIRLGDSFLDGLGRAVGRNDEDTRRALQLGTSYNLACRATDTAEKVHQFQHDPGAAVAAPAQNAQAKAGPQASVAQGYKAAGVDLKSTPKPL